MHVAVRTCIGCGCTDDRACPGGCYWIDADLCSACVRLEYEADTAAKGILVSLALGLLLWGLIILGLLKLFSGGENEWTLG